jgi:uncharacterized membrane protein
MNKLQITLAYIFAVILILAGINHFINPRVYSPFIPDWMPLILVNVLTGIVEIVLGTGLLLQKYRRQAAFGVFILMLLFLPLHIADVFKDQPAIGSKTAAWVRLPIQFLFIYAPWYIFRTNRKT